MQRKRGFTLMEIIVALLLLSVVVIGFLPVFVSANRLNNNSELNFEAQSIAQKELELIMYRASKLPRRELPDNYEEVIFAGFSVSSHPDLKGKIYKSDLVNDFSVYLETYLPNRINSIRISVYDGSVLRYQTEDWIRFD